MHYKARSKKMKKKLGLILSVVALVFCLLNVIGFFVPTTKMDTKGTDLNVTLSSMEIAFTSKDSAAKKSATYQSKAMAIAAEKQTEIVTELIQSGTISSPTDPNVSVLVQAKLLKDNKAFKSNYEKAQKYGALYQVKSDKTANLRAGFGAWAHFISLIVSVAAIVFITLNLCGLGFAWVAKILTAAAFALAFIGAISYIALLNTTLASLGGIKISKMFSVHAGIILGVIATLLAACAEWLTLLPCCKKQAE